MADLPNLRRAYRWLRTNPEATYKGYFRDSFAAYAASPEQNLATLHRQLLDRSYQPTSPSRVFLPKPTGITRTYTLLTLTDQVVYQACANVIAERLLPKARAAYLNTVFGHMYAGSRSQFFFRRWQTGYKAFSRAVAHSVISGDNYVASFDLAAFYDSIDHRVLGYFLVDLGLDRDFIEFLLACLRRWTATRLPRMTAPLEHGHGIPQGPLASGLLSEVVLQHFDRRATRTERGHPRKSPRYLRYVDDIRIFAKGEAALRRRLVDLDLAAKEIGLFAQGAKIDIRRVVDAADEVKSISGEQALVTGTHPAQSTLRQRVLALSRGNLVRPADKSAFKYLLGHATPHWTLNHRLVTILVRQPDLYEGIAAYFSRQTNVPGRASEELLDYLIHEEVYQTPHAALLSAIIDNVDTRVRHQITHFCKVRLTTPDRNLLPLQPVFRAALLGWLVRWDGLSYAALDSIVSKEVDWWVQKDWLKQLSADRFGPATYAEVLSRMVRHGGEEPARIAALKIVDDDLPVPSSSSSIELSAQLLFREAQHILTPTAPHSGVGLVLNRVLGADLVSFPWAKFFGSRHRRAQHLAFEVNRAYDSDIDVCLVRLDSLFDLIWEIVFSAELPGKTYGQYGSMLGNRHLRERYPMASAGLRRLHELRLQSMTSHPRLHSTGAPTRRLKHRDFHSVAPGLRAAAESIAKRYLGTESDT